MAKTTEADTVIIVDDELQDVLWLADYLDSEGLFVQFASNVNEAIDLVDQEIYRALIVDLQIPVLPPQEAPVHQLGPLYSRYPGLFVARHARSRGYRDRQVVIYSVHKDGEVAEEARRLGCTYILKGRPREIKAELTSILSFDPTVEAP
jgi:CheY-like chemotaxis protein